MLCSWLWGKDQTPQLLVRMSIKMHCKAAISAESRIKGIFTFHHDGSIKLTDLSPVSPNSGSRIWCKILKNLTKGMPDSSDVISSLTFHWLAFSGYCFLSWNLNLVKPDSVVLVLCLCVSAASMQIRQPAADGNWSLTLHICHCQVYATFYQGWTVDGDTIWWIFNSSPIYILISFNSF